jgi:hypothetical protein
MSMRTWSPPVIFVSSALAMFEGVVAPDPSPLRTALVLWFLAVCPGLAAIGLLGLRDPWLALAVVPALSFAIDLIVGGVLSYAGVWSASAALTSLVAISAAGALMQDAVAARLAQQGKLS